MEDMTKAEYQAFLSEGTRTGKLSTVRKNGKPHVTPIWFVLDGDDLIFNTWYESIKGRNIQRSPYVTLCVDDEQPPYSFVIVEGEATIDEVTSEERIAWATRIGGRYMGEDRAEEFGQRNGVEGELVVRIKPTKVIAKKDVSG